MLSCPTKVCPLPPYPKLAAYPFDCVVVIELYRISVGRDWKWRPPPRGFTADSYTLCESFVDSSVCHYGNQCVEAHGNDELREWKERFEYRKMRLQRACEKELYGKSYTEQLLEKWVSILLFDPLC